MALFEDARIRVYSISYDTQEQLPAFANQYEVTYDLLSDTDSAVIRELGILNTLISPDDPRRGAYGVPFPGVYVTDENGVVTEKFFHRHYATRESAGAIRDSALATFWHVMRSRPSNWAPTRFGSPPSCPMHR